MSVDIESGSRAFKTGNIEEQADIIKNKSNATVNSNTEVVFNDPHLCFSSIQSNSIRVDFENINLNVKIGSGMKYMCKRKERKQILMNLNGTFDSQDLVAIIGPSGSGKSSLMNVLAGYKERGTYGNVLINGTKRNSDRFRKLSCYIMQDDCLMHYQTVMEYMMVAANLKTRLSKTTKLEIVNEILVMLGLDKVTKTYVQNLSGGQLKRLAIALELINNPPVMFLDEPTSGLDSSTSFQVISLLRVLAHGGRTIICTIHQPSAKLFELFDQVYVLAEGRCVYDGNTVALLPFLEHFGLKCPEYHNPADFLLEVASGDYGNVPELVHAVTFGKCEEFQKKYPRNLSKSMIIEKLFDANSAESSTKSKSTKNMVRNSRKLLRVPTHANDLSRTCDIYVLNQFKQFHILFWRMTRAQLRNPSVTHMRVISHILVGFALGLLYLDIGNEAELVLNNAGFLFFCSLFIMFASLMPALLTITLELPTFIREHLNYWYSLDAYYWARSAADIPYQIIFPLVFSATAYFLSGQPSETGRFLIFSLVLVLVSLISQAFGMLVGVVIPHAETATFVGPIFMVPMTLFSGFFVKFDTIPWYMKWLSYISYPRYAFEAELLAIYGNNRSALDCSAGHPKEPSNIMCFYQNATNILIEMNIKNAEPWNAILVLFGFFFVFKILSYFAFRIRVDLQT